MARNYSATAKESINSLGGYEPPLFLLQITHPNLATPLRVVSDTQDIPGNMLLYSEQFDDAAWLKVNGLTVTATNILAPDGSLTARQVTSNGTSDPILSQSNNSGGALAGRTFTLSFYLRIDAGQPIAARLFLIDASYGAINSVGINLSTSWQRFSLTATFPPGETDTVVEARFDFSDDGLPPAGSFFYIWRAQLSETTTLLDYIKTTTIAYPKYTAMAFRLVPPDDLSQGQPRARLSIDNVGRELTSWLESSAGGKGAVVRLMQVMRSAPNVLELDITMQLDNVNMGMLEVSGELGFDDIYNRPACTVLYTPTVAPGLF